MKDEVRGWLENGEVDIFLGYKMVHGHPLPHSFGKDNLEEIDELVVGSVRYPLEKMAAEIIAEKPDVKVGILAHDCTQRALNVLSISNQLNISNVKVQKINCCPSPLKEHVSCSYLNRQESWIHKKQVGIDNNMDPGEMEDFTQEERFTRWMYEFQKCLKCYGCRDICPVCFCKECSLENPDLVGTGALPVEVPVFHLVRAVHMAGRCVDCGLCEEACPVKIPLRLLYRKVNEIVKELFHYETGSSLSPPPFSVLDEKVTLEPRPVKDAA
jgi:ferredoxin